MAVTFGDFSVDPFAVTKMLNSHQRDLARKAEKGVSKLLAEPIEAKLAAIKLPIGNP